MNNHAYVFGAQFVMWKIDIKGTLLDKKYTSKGVSCSVCKTSKTSSVIMIPGRKECYAGMTKEYGGYLMSGYHAHAGASQYICVDANADTCASSGTSWRKLLYPVESVCEGTLKCPPYINGAEMTCVVCSM
ncbi:hypothetical protein FSP39_001605 [Pinctada imbricata]|uniref:Uncharacterized protein n=1 Tax=Pinctada imbricata TaxID=66713 RepID=A0AA88Y2M7_PINIB|nr:hypothetical protein FSP39_001605 [Pinctada imbricata]